jgi:hypothetical protein
MFKSLKLKTIAADLKEQIEATSGTSKKELQLQVS